MYCLRISSASSSQPSSLVIKYCPSEPCPSTNFVIPHTNLDHLVINLEKYEQSSDQLQKNKKMTKECWHSQDYLNHFYANWNLIYENQQIVNKTFRGCNKFQWAKNKVDCKINICNFAFISVILIIIIIIIMQTFDGIPEIVPQEYKDQLEKFQIQIKILLQNHQVCTVYQLIFDKTLQFSKIFNIWEKINQK